MVTQRAKSLLLCYALLVPTAAIASPTYTVTELGSGGSSLAFTPNRNDLPADWNTVLGDVPTPVRAPSYPPPVDGYSFSSLSAMNANGLTVGIDRYGGSGLGYHVELSEVFAVQHQSDGSWGQPQSLWGGAPVYVSGSNGLTVGGISNTGQILGAGPLYPSLAGDGAPQQWWLYNSTDRSLTKLDSLLPGTGWTVESASIDADGRILAQVFHTFRYGTAPDTEPDYFLLTPTASPLPTPAPEPTTLTLLVAAVCAGLLRRSARPVFSRHRVLHRQRV